MFAKSGTLNAAPKKNLQDNSGDFPDGFIFGTGTSAYQVEGAATEGGRGISVWDDLTLRTPNMIDDGSNGNVACDMYHRYKIFDFMAKSLTRHDTFRDSLSLGSSQLLTTEYGGMLSDQVVNDFVEFANLCFEEFGDRVKFWATMNEPYTYVIHGYSPGTDFAKDDSKIVQSSSKRVQRNLPSHRNERLGRFKSTAQTTRHTWFIVNDPAKETYTVAKNLLLCHSRTVQLYRTNFQMHQSGQIGIVLSSGGHYPFDSTSQNDIDATQRAFDFMIGWFLEPVIYGQFPASMLQYAKGNITPLSNEEQQELAGSSDWVGLN
ncbi:Raucaffricine-O-beta-D-glucosidase [Sesamum angolense]|uniref:Raucaffricine-O-beta-D-glucosidase n=1 Tax=Sesamum angolense TaxID=2727404 RepID=A0AAE2BQW9_9LAMI|nr:Raucaffricine-O-beta-D-glucosidase [Sesamum angolense]